MNNLYAVRHIADQQAVGIFFAIDHDALYCLVGDVTDPSLCEYCEIDGPAAIAWPIKTTTIGVDVHEMDAGRHIATLRGGVSFMFGLEGIATVEKNEIWVPLERWTGGACVYFIRGGDYIKIGWTSGSPSKRMAALSTGNHERLNLLLAVSGTRTEERRLHRKFRDLKHRREWFRAEDPLLDFIATALP